MSSSYWFADGSAFSSVLPYILYEPFLSPEHLNFHHEYAYSMFLQNVEKTYQTARRHISEHLNINTEVITACNVQLWRETVTLYLYGV